MNRKKAVNVLMGVLALLLVVGMAYQFTPNVGQLFNRSATTGTPALKVDGKIVTVEDLANLKRSNQAVASLETGVLADDAKLFVVSRKIDQTLVAQGSADIKVSRSDVNDKVNDIRKQNDLTDNKKWTDALQNVGLTDVAFRQQVTESLAIEKKLADIKAKAPAATDAEAKTYFDLNKDKFQTDARIVGRQIVVANEAKAKELLAAARKGDDFAKLASANSLENKDRGGALGPLENGVPRPVASVALPPVVAAAAFSLTTGGITDVISANNKFYIIKVEKYLPAGPKTFDVAKDDVMTALKNQKQDAAVESWVDGLRANAKVEYLDPAWKVSDDVVASVEKQKIHYSEVVGQVFSDQRFSGLLNQMSPEQVAPMVNSVMKPGIVEQLIQGYTAATVAKKLDLSLVGSRQEIAQSLMGYGARNVKVTETDIQDFYNQNKAQYTTSASAKVDEAIFKDKNQALAFRADWDGKSSFTMAATKGGGTVSERGDITVGDGKLTLELEAAVFKAKTLKAVGSGSLSDVVKVGDNFSLLYVTDLKPESTQPLAEVHSQIETQVLGTKKTTEGQKFLKAQVATLKPVDNLKAVLAAQAKRVAAADAAAAKATPATPSPATPTPAKP